MKNIAAIALVAVAMVFALTLIVVPQWNFVSVFLMIALIVGCIAGAMRLYNGPRRSR